MAIKHNIKKHTHQVHHKKKVKKAHIWMGISAALVVLFIISLTTCGFSGCRKSVALTSDEASEKALTYINNVMLQGQQPAEIKEVEELEDLYSILLDINGREFTSYVTKDGGLLFPAGYEIAEAPETPDTPVTPETPQAPPTPEVPKSETPLVELFVMSHCPYGTQIEKGIIPVMQVLGDKADIQVKFCDYAMHGKAELDEQLVQYCVQEEEPDKFVEYLSCFLNEGKGDECILEAGLYKKGIDDCVAAADAEFKVSENFADQSTYKGRFATFNVFKEEVDRYGVGGSPTFVVNGVTISNSENNCPAGKPCAVVPNQSRSPASLLSTICAAFENPPEECLQELDSATPAPGFGFEGSAASSAGGCA